MIANICSMVDLRQFAMEQVDKKGKRIEDVIVEARQIEEYVKGSSRIPEIFFPPSDIVDNKEKLTIHTDFT